MRLHASTRRVISPATGSPDQVFPQVKALFDALKNKAEITYVNSVISFNPHQGFRHPAGRLPRESLADKEANCIDGTVLFASLLEGISMNPAIVLMQHIVAWETWSDSQVVLPGNDDDSIEHVRAGMRFCHEDRRSAR